MGGWTGNGAAWSRPGVLRDSPGCGTGFEQSAAHALLYLCGREKTGQPRTADSAPSTSNPQRGNRGGTVHERRTALPSFARTESCGNVSDEIHKKTKDVLGESLKMSAVWAEALTLFFIRNIICTKCFEKTGHFSPMPDTKSQREGNYLCERTKNWAQRRPFRAISWSPPAWWA